MNVSRKDFFRKSLFSIGDALGALSGLVNRLDLVADEQAEAVRQQYVPRPDMIAEPFNDRCLARNCGCFACAERCPSGAILVVPGDGVRIDEGLCSGCGTCEYVCPVAPKAIVLVPKAAK